MSQRALGVACVVTVSCLGSLRSHKAEFKLSLRLPEGLTRSDLQHKTTNLAVVPSSYAVGHRRKLRVGRFPPNAPEGCFTPLTPLSGATSSCKRSLDEERKLLRGRLVSRNWWNYRYRTLSVQGFPLVPNFHQDTPQEENDNLNRYRAVTNSEQGDFRRNGRQVRKLWFESREHSSFLL